MVKKSALWTGIEDEILPFGKDKGLDSTNDLKSQGEASGFVNTKVEAYEKDGWVCTGGTLSYECKLGKRKVKVYAYEQVIPGGGEEKVEEASEGGEEVSVELHVEFHISKEQFDSDDVSAAINDVLENAVHDIGDLGLEVETHILAGSYLEPVSEPGAVGENFGLTKEELQDAIEFLYTEQEANEDEAQQNTGKEKEEFLESVEYIQGIRDKLAKMRDSYPGASAGGTSRKPLEPSHKTDKEIEKTRKRDFP